jgi:hypothetical protein
MILNSKLRKFAEETTDILYRIYYEQILNGEICLDIQKEYYFLIVNETNNYFLKIEEYEKCEKLNQYYESNLG